MTTSFCTDKIDGQQPYAAPHAGDERMISPRFAQVLRENSRRRQDWIAAAEQLSNDYERRFCLRRAGELR
jgi:hypothetical protein